WPFRRVIMPAARLLSYYFRARVSGIEHIPRDRPVIYVGKHPRTYLYLETILLGRYAFWDSDRPPIRVLEETGTSLHKTPVVGWVRRHVHALPATAAHALRALARGESLLIFPGGTRELYGPPDELQWDARNRSILARIAMRAGAPIVPFAIRGADRQHPWRLSVAGSSVWLPPLPLPVRLEYRFGRPIDPPAEGEEDVEAFAGRVEAATRELIAGERPAASRAARHHKEDVVPLDPQRARYRFCYCPALRALSRYHRLRIEGEAPSGPCIYVAHHGAGYFTLDLAIAVYQLAWHPWFIARRPFRPLRIVGARGHAMERALPGLARLKRSAGIIEPSEASCLAALERGEQLLITPGGSREASPRARDYQLRWNDRHGFVRLALRTGVPVVPVAVVGGFAAYPGFAMGKLSFWSPVPLPARLDLAIGRPFEIPRQPERARDPAVVKPLQQDIREATQALYDGLVARRTRTAQ
ncbi:MAG TPA: 1-acyl-sn-glycerol-3-phosphate acyltransferase, partial [Vicinamibacterales bacterium]|nr:1-acyl-sn-glycerol-3-phosphate acyltransferase [Vicinamibacterales bacterium]